MHEGPWTGVGSRLLRVFAIDLRSLALFRIALGLLLALDLVSRSSELRTFYTDEGVLPAALLSLTTSAGDFSIHTHLGAWPTLVALLFAVQLAAALALCAGFRTRAATVLCWVLLASLHLRNPQLAYPGGDRILRLLLFWSMFLPLGARFAWDARRRATPAPREIRSAGSAALLLQIALVYWSNGLNKIQGEGWLEGDALSYVLGITFFGGPLAPWLAGQHWLGAFGSWATIGFELLAPCFAFVPWRNDWMRLGAVAAFVGFHVLLAGAFSIGSFPYVCIVAWLVFLPGVLWDRLSRRAPALGAAGALYPAPHRALQLVAGALLALVFAQVAAGHLRVALPRPAVLAAQALRIHQHWGQFESVRPVDFWATLHGTTAAGGSVDPLRGGAPLRGHPGRAADLFPTYSWRIYFYNLIQRAIEEPSEPALEALTARLADTLCRRWNAGHADGDRIVQLRVAYVAEYFDPAAYHAPTEVYALERPCDPTPSARRRAAAPPR
jgi:hypothetical protein